MTDYKFRRKEPRHHSLYLGLLLNILKGILLAVIVYFTLYLSTRYLINYWYVTPSAQRVRRENYVDSLQSFVNDNEIYEDDVGKISEWIRANPYVYLMVYQNSRVEPMSYSGIASYSPGPKNKFTEYTGSRIDESLVRDQLIAAATSGGYYKIVLADGSVTVAIAEYTQNFYYISFNLFSIVAAGLTFILSLVRYIRLLIARIKRFEGDVTIVSEIDMGYEIVSEGADELSNLSGKVEQMRQKMLEHIKSEQEAREANTELITSISHDIRTPLTVLMGYIEMMKKREENDEIMESYISATETTALRLKQLSDDMLKYSLAFGDTENAIKLEEYDAPTLFEQLFAEHFLLMREMGYNIHLSNGEQTLKTGDIIRTDAPNLMRIIDNIFSNMRKYADPAEPIYFYHGVENRTLKIECKNKIRTDTEGAESNGIGLKTCVRLASLVAKKFEYEQDGEYFICRLIIQLKETSAEG